MSTILVTGGTGTLGRPVVARLRDAGHEVRALSRHAPQYPVDLLTGNGLDAATAGAEVIVHCASDTRGGGKNDVAATRHLIDAARRAGTVTNIVYISIVGVDVVPFGYYRTKLKVEQQLERSGLGVTILRTTQFHDLVAQVVDMAAKLPLLPVPVPGGVRVQPVAVGE
ncbi:SDR family oxidoreductase, partial [Streptomyces sp. NPDC059538]